MNKNPTRGFRAWLCRHSIRYTERGWRDFYGDRLRSKNMAEKFCQFAMETVCSSVGQGNLLRRSDDAEAFEEIAGEMFPQLLVRREYPAGGVMVYFTIRR